MCEGDDCNRANCHMGECFHDNEQSVECVKIYKNGEEYQSFCRDCWGDECAKMKAISLQKALSK